MNRQRVVALWRRVVQEVRRDRASMGLLFVLPVVLTGLFAFVLRGQQAATVNAAVVDGAGASAAPFVAALGRSLASAGGTLVIAADADDADARVRDGSASIALVIPPGFTADLAAGNAPDVTVVTPGLEPSADSGQVQLLSRALAQAVDSIMPAGSPRPPTVTTRTLFGAAAAGDLVDHLAPVYIGFFAYFFVYILTGVSFLRERTGGTLERLMATPVSRSEVVLGYCLGFGVFATLQVAVLLAWSLLDVQVPAIGPLPAFSVGLNVPVAGSPLLAYLVVLLLALGAVSLGIFLSSFARTELQVIQFIPVVIVPQALLSGILFPVSALPDVLQPISRLLPLTYAVDGLRQVVIRGADLSSAALQTDLVVLLGFALAFAVLAALTIRREVV
ncbi:MAG: ABC transporter permease [Candidatus Limnocylindrales bacterium]